EARRQWKPATDNRIAAHEPEVDIEQMHRTTVAARKTGRFAEQFGHYRARRCTFRQTMTVLAISRDHVILIVQGRNRANSDGFLAGIEMAKTGDLAARVHLSGFFLEAPYQHHIAIQLKELSFVHRKKGALSNM